MDLTELDLINQKKQSLSDALECDVVLRGRKLRVHLKKGSEKGNTLSDDRKAHK